MAQLNYLYRHLNVPPVNLAPLPAAVLALAVVLRTGLTKIATDNVLVPDPIGDVTRTRLTLLFDSGVVDQTINLLNGTAVYNAPLASLPDALAKKDPATHKTVGIDPTQLPAAVANKTTYDPKNGLLHFQGGMTDAEQAALLSASPDPAYQAAVQALYQQPATFIQNTLSGFLDPVPAEQNLLRDTASLDGDLNSVLLDGQDQVTLDPTLAISTAIAWKFAYLLTALLPYLRNQLSHTFVKQTIAETFKLDSTLAQLLLETLLQAASSPQQALIVDLLALDTPGLTGQYFASPDLSGAATTDTAAGVAYDGSSVTLPAGAGSARWDGKLVAPNNGSFTFSVHSNGTAQLWLDDPTQPLLQIDPSTNDLVSQPLPLKAGQLYTLHLEARQLPSQSPVIVLSWQSATTPKAIIPADAFYPDAALALLSLAYTRLQKAAMLLNAFKLNDQELAYLSNPTHPNDFAGFNLNLLPLTCKLSQANDQAAPALMAAWLRVSAYVKLRNSLPHSDTSLIDVFNAVWPDDTMLKLAQTTGWPVQDIQMLSGGNGFNLGPADFTNDIAVLRLQDAENLVSQLGVSVDQLLSWSSLPTDYSQLSTTYFDELNDIAQDLKKTVQAKYDEDSWPTAAKPLNDQLRQSQRDALVAYLLAHLQLSDPNQLFEYFLIDTEMEACMETSRIKQALSSIQLFVQRCLMNLEERSDIPELSVSPSAIDADQWEWMQYYRVWEANREIFLYPENWIVPSCAMTRARSSRIWNPNCCKTRPPRTTLKRPS